MRQRGRDRGWEGWQERVTLDCLDYMLHWVRARGDLQGRGTRK